MKADILEKALREISDVTNLQALDAIRVVYIGKNGLITDKLKEIGKLSIEKRKAAGQEINQIKQQIIQAIEDKKDYLAKDLVLAKIKAEKIDVTMPACSKLGSLHPVTKVTARMMSFFEKLGFECAEGPEVDTAYYNFEALNIPFHHPARAMHDTFYCEHDLLLRTHTSTVQIRTMENRKPPLRIIAPGRVYRCDSDLTHTPMFHQFEGFMVDTDINMGHLKGILTRFFQVFFEKDLKSRLRPSYFPFTEPSAEMDFQCVNCEGKGCKICKNTGWLEVLGCGMINPVVLENCGIDSEQYTGFAFGGGLDRLAMLRYQINDLRILFENDLRFLDQF